MEVKGLPAIAFTIACSMAHVVKTLVGRPMHVAIVNGLKRKLYGVNISQDSYNSQQLQYNDIHGRNDITTPSPFLTGRGKEFRCAGFARLGDLVKRICTEQVDYNVEDIREYRIRRRVWEEREEREKQRCLVVDAAIVRRDIMIIQE